MARFGPDHRDTVRASDDLVDAFYQGSRFAEAEPLYRRALKRALQKVPPATNELITVYSRLGISLLRLDRPAEAEAVFREAAVFTRPIGGIAYFNALGNVAGSLTPQKKYAEAEPLLLEAHAGLIEAEARNPEASRAARSRGIAGALAHLYELWGKPEQAAPWRQPEKN
jgi:Flp pilus assembly protein TadD